MSEFRLHAIFFVVAALGLAAGFLLGSFYAAAPVIGCRESDLTPVPDTEFLTPTEREAPAASVPEELPAPPEKWVCLTFDDGTKGLAFAWPTVRLVVPTFDLQTTISLALPLFLVTMASQNIPGWAVLAAVAPVDRVVALPAREEVAAAEPG